MFSCIVAIGLSSLAPAVDSAVQKHYRNWIQQLGDPSFRKREAAAKAILDIGNPIQKALQAALKHSDPEIRERARRLYAELPFAPIYKGMRLLRDDRIDPAKIDLPGWQCFRTAVGSDKAARKFYADLMLNKLPLLRHLDSSPWNAKLLHNRIYQTATKTGWEITTDPIRVQMLPDQREEDEEEKEAIELDIWTYAALLVVSMEKKVLEKATKSTGRQGGERSGP